MRLIANIVLILSLTLGALSAASAYMVSLSRPAESLVGLTLKAPAGFTVNDEGEVAPLFEYGHTLTAEDVAALQAQNGAEVEVQGRTRTVTRVLVKEFSFGRWQGKWLFLLSLVGLCVGAFLVQSAMRSEIASAEADHGERETPEDALASIDAILNGLIRDVPGMASDSERCAAIVERISEAEGQHVPVFVEARALLISRLGLSGFASLMDRFAAMERQMNRAWSAAADDHYTESFTCLERAHVLMAETQERMGANV